MTLQTEKYIRQARPVDAVKVTDENIKDVAAWCNGLHIPKPGLAGAGENFDQDYVYIASSHPNSTAQTRAFPGDWIIREDFRRFRIITNKQFKNSYERVNKPKGPVPTPKAMPAKKTDPTPEPAGPVQVGAVEVVPGTPPDEGSSLTTGTTKTVHRSAESGEFVTEAVADANPDTTVEETVSINGNELSDEEKALLAEMEAEEAADTNNEKENDVNEQNEQNELGTVEAGPDDLQADALAPTPTDDVVPGDMIDPDQPEQDADGTVQLGVPVESSDEAPSLCGSCGSETVDGVCSKDTDHNVFGTAEQAEPDALPGD